MQPYPAEVEQAMKRYFATLVEKEQRLYAAVQALKLGRGGQRYIAELLGCSERTVSRGLPAVACPFQKLSPDRLVTAPTPGEKWLHVIFLVLVMGTSFLFGLSENGVLPVAKGIVQRSLYLVSFIWLFLSLRLGS
jgi:hypothetical protein